MKHRKRPYQQNIRCSDGFIDTIAELQRLPKYIKDDHSTWSLGDILHDMLRQYALLTLGDRHRDKIDRI